MISKILSQIGQTREAIIDLFTGRDRSKMQSDKEELGSELSGYKWSEDSTDNSIQKSPPASPATDVLADTAFRARPSNPLGDDR